MERTLNKGVATLALFAAWIGIATIAGAFHDGSSASCGGCHISHNTVDGQNVVTHPGLLLHDNPSDVCLLCHEHGPGEVMSIDPLFPSPEQGAGNFVFLLEDNLNDGPDGLSNPISGDAAGHSIVATGRGLFPDSRYAVAPGGSYPSNQLGCTSCHDPHGNANFRMLWGAGDEAQGFFTFSNSAPDADGIDLAASVESDSNHSAYRSGMTDWCGNCHGFRYHDSHASLFEHDVDHVLDAEIRDRYNAYNGDDDPTGGNQASAYLAPVPFESPGSDVNSSAGPQGSSVIMCLSCHRAHASSSPAAGRWDFRVSLLADDGLESGSYPIPDPYNSPSQGRLCSKCHVPGSITGAETVIGVGNP